MEKETVEGLRLGTVMIIVAATLAVGSIIFWYARMYSGHYFDAAAAQNQQVKTLELDAINTEGIMDVPLASVYTIISREWRAVSDVSVFDKAGTLVKTATVNGTVWMLSEPLTKADGSAVTKLIAPEQILYAASGGVYRSRLSGRAFLSVHKVSLRRPILYRLNYSNKEVM